MKNLIIVALICLTFSITITAQILTQLPCYTVNNNNGNGPSNLFMYDPATDYWSNLGELDPIGDDVEAIAIDPANKIIYMYDAGNRQFGTVDPNSANPTLFVPNSACNGPGVGTANGDYGEIDLDDVDGLTFDTNNNILFATHHIPSGDLCNLIENTNDLLFQIDPATGCYIPGAMLDKNGNPADYAIIEEVIDATLPNLCEVGGGEAYDVADIAYNPYTGQLFAAQNQAGGPGVISVIDLLSGETEAVILDIDEDNIEGLAFTMLGELYATSGDGGPTGPQNAFIYIDLQSQNTTVLSFPDPTGTSVDFAALDCLQLSNDLALQMVLDPSNNGTLQAGDDVTFNITVSNQGNFDNSDILITNYIPDGLILNDQNWVSISGSNNAEIVISDILSSGNSAQVSITFTIDPAFTGGTISNIAEISASFNESVQDYYGNFIPLPDNDSTPDDVNNDDEAEDDHDAATITISNGEGNPDILVITKDTPFQNLYESNVKIITDGPVLIRNGEKVKYQTKEIIELNNNFDAQKGAEFEGKIE